MQRTTMTLLLLVLLACGVVPAQDRPRILVYTRNGQGYVHDNIPAAIAALRQLGAQNGMTVDATDDASVFTERGLAPYSALVFASTNNDVFDSDAQRVVMRRYIEAGGGLVGLHSVMGTERNWRWFKMLIGGTFAWHPPFQVLRVRRLDSTQASVRELPGVWQHEDELYFLKELYPGVRVLLAHELAGLQPGEEQRIAQYSAPFADYYPATWYQSFDGGTAWITTLGHDRKDYSDPVYLRHVLGGLRFVLSQSRRPDFSRAYATNRDDPVR